MEQKQHRMSLKCLQPFFDLPARPTKIDQKWKFLTSVFFCPIWIKFGMGVNNGAKTTLNEFDMPTTIFRPTSLTNKKWKFLTSVFFNTSTDTPDIPSRTITLFRFFLFLSCLSIGHQFWGWRILIVVGAGIYDGAMKQIVSWVQKRSRRSNAKISLGSALSEHLGSFRKAGGTEGGYIKQDSVPLDPWGPFGMTKTYLGPLPISREYEQGNTYLRIWT